MSEPEVSALISVRQAVQIIDATPVTPRVVRVKLADAQHLHLAEDVRCDRDAPPFDKSLMDGFAVRCADLDTGLQNLHISGEIAAGQAADADVNMGQAMAIMTGAPLPPGADGIVPVEDAEVSGQTVTIRQRASPGRYIARRGSDCRAGSVILKAGTLLGSPQLAVAASVGAAEVSVYARPRVAVLCTGDELVDINQTPGPFQIRNSNELMLVALLRQLGCEVRSLGNVRDDALQIRNRLATAIADHDAVFVAGGMSMGKYDQVPAVLRELNVETKITKLRIKPGKPFVFGVVGESGTHAATEVADPRLPSRRGQSCYVFGLPGNPVSGFVCTRRLAARLLRRMSGGDAEERWIEAALTAPLEANGPREFYQPAKLLEGRHVTPLQWKGSADIYTLAQANALLVREENEPARSVGDVVRLIEL